MPKRPRFWVSTLFVVAAITLGGKSPAAQPDLIPALQKLASQDNAEAIYHLGMAYHTGSGITRDQAKALAAFRRAAHLGDPLAAYKLGCYYGGQGEGLVDADAELELSYKLVAAKAGYALAQQDVGAIYGRRGDGASALAWLEKSAAQGWSGGLMGLASAYNGAPGIEPDPVKTSAYFRLFLDRERAGSDQRAWLDRFDAKMSTDDRAKVQIIVQGYRPSPSPLTIKGLSGQRAAEQLVGETS